MVSRKKYCGEFTLDIFSHCLFVHTKKVLKESSTILYIMCRGKGLWEQEAEKGKEETESMTNTQHALALPTVKSSNSRL